jgi:hypothetical protein
MSEERELIKSLIKRGLAKLFLKTLTVKLEDFDKVIRPEAWAFFEKAIDLADYDSQLVKEAFIEFRLGEIDAIMKAKEKYYRSYLDKVGKTETRRRKRAKNISA